MIMQQWDIVMEKYLPLKTANKEKKDSFHIYNYSNSATYFVVSSIERWEHLNSLWNVTQASEKCKVILGLGLIEMTFFLEWIKVP
jgi:hypothetical protein